MIRLRFRWDEEAFVRASRINDLLRTKRGPFRHLKWLFLALFLSGLYQSLTDRRHISLVVSILLTGYWYFLRWPVNRLFYRRKFGLHASAGEEIEITVDERGFRGGTASSRGEFTWDVVGRVVEATDGFFILQYPIFYWIPLEAFAQGADIDWFRVQARERAKEYMKVRW